MKRAFLLVMVGLFAVSLAVVAVDPEIRIGEDGFDIPPKCDLIEHDEYEFDDPLIGCPGTTGWIVANAEWSLEACCNSAGHTLHVIFGCGVFTGFFSCSTLSTEFQIDDTGGGFGSWMAKSGTDSYAVGPGCFPYKVKARVLRSGYSDPADTYILVLVANITTP